MTPGNKAVNGKWHIDNSISAGVVVVLIIQIISFVWIIAQMESRLTAVEAKTLVLQAELHTVPERLVRLETILERIERKMSK